MEWQALRLARLINSPNRGWPVVNQSYLRADSSMETAHSAQSQSKRLLLANLDLIDHASLARCRKSGPSRLMLASDLLNVVSYAS